MTHGEQTKAKAAKTSKASGIQKSSTKTAGKAVQTGKGGKAPEKSTAKSGAKEGGEAGKAAKIVVKKDQAGPEKGSSASAAKGASSPKETGNGGKGAGKGRPAPAEDGAPGFSNPAVANAFKRAVKKYSNAFRKLTD